jgi:hypothetical protein
MTDERFEQLLGGADELAKVLLRKERSEQKAKLGTARTALEEIRDHSLEFDIDEIPHIAREALAQIGSGQKPDSDFQKRVVKYFNGYEGKQEEVKAGIREKKIEPTS